MDQTIQHKLDEHFSSHKVKIYNAGDTIIHAGEDPTGVSQLLSGTVEKFDITPEGNQVTVNIFKPPAFFPMSWAINKTPNTYFYSALSTVELRTAGADETVAFLHDNPDVMFNLLSRLYKGTDGLLRRHVFLARGIASSRVIFELLLECYRFGVKLDDGKTRIKVKQTTLAARCALARETISRELHKLEKNDLLRMENDGITIDVTKLEKQLDTVF